MSVTASARSACAGVVLAALIGSCGGAAALAPSPTASPSPSVVATAAPSPAAGALLFNIDASSRATVKVREQLARIPAPSDAALTIGGVTGSFTLNPDGSFSPSSKITVDLTTLTSDERQRADFVKRDPLEVSRFPRAEFVPTKTTGLALPLPALGDLTFKLAGNMTIHGATKEVTFDVTATRQGSKLTATATAAPSWRFGDFGMKPPSTFLVLSIVDEIRLEFSLVASEVRA